MKKNSNIHTSSMSLLGNPLDKPGFDALLETQEITTEKIRDAFFLNKINNVDDSLVYLLGLQSLLVSFFILLMMIIFPFQHMESLLIISFITLINLVALGARSLYLGHIKKMTKLEEIVAAFKNGLKNS